MTGGRRRAGLVFAVCAAGCYGATTALAISRDPTGWCSMLVGCLVIFTCVPVVMAAALTVVSGFLAVVLLALAVVLGRGRPTGVGEVLAELMGLAPPIVPTYYRLLMRVRSPVFWGVMAGLGATTVHLVIHSSGASAA